MITIEIRSYAHNGADWEWDGLAWGASLRAFGQIDNVLAAEAASGDWAGREGENIMLRAYLADSPLEPAIAEYQFVPGPDGQAEE